MNIHTQSQANNTRKIQANPSSPPPTYLVLVSLVVSDGVSLVEDDAVPPKSHQAVATLALHAATVVAVCNCGCFVEGFLSPAGGEVAGQGVVGGDHLSNRFVKRKKKQHSTWKEGSRLSPRISRGLCLR